MNVNVFKVIDSKEKAYWLGFLMADGGMRKDCKQFRLILSVKDEHHLTDFINFIEDDISKKKYYGPYKTSGKQVHYVNTNHEFYDNLYNLGCKPNKERNLKLIKFNNKELNLAFLLGFYDGDGSEGATDITCSSKRFLKSIQLMYNLTTSIKLRKNQFGQAYNMSLGITLFQEMIKNFNGGLQRKRYIRYRKNSILKTRSQIQKECQTSIDETTCKKWLQDDPDLSYSQIAIKNGVSRTGFYKARKRYGLVDKPY